MSPLSIVVIIYGVERNIFTHDAMRKRGLCCRPVSVRLTVRLSVCLSRWCIVADA